MPKINLWGLLREGSEGKNYIETSGETILEAVEMAVKNCPSLKNKLCSKQGEINKYLRFYVNESCLSPAQYATYILNPEDTITVIIPLAGGNGSKKEK